MTDLFAGQPDHAPAISGGAATSESDRVVGVAVAANLWKSLDYLWPGGSGEPQLGQRVKVPLGKGNRKTLGFVVDTLRRAEGRKNLKPVADLVDAHSQLDEPLWKLAQWISHYYLTPLGMTLAAMIPSVVGRQAELTETCAYLTGEPGDWPDRLGSRQRKVLDELLEARKQGVEPLEMESLCHHSGASRESVNRLCRRGLIRLETRPVRLPELQEEAGAPPFELNEPQRSVLAALEPKLAGGFSTTLLYGVTGSGKTEIYVRAIRQVNAAGRQAILLVPEIALATQTMGRLLARLGRVAVLHSGLTGSQRAHYYQQIRDGHAAVVVGPRSAIFAPARRLGLIIVDEEHEPTYKQDNAPRYHGRDVAVMRGRLTGVPVLLGSATPSLESYHNAQAGRYDLLRLPQRVRGLPMPRLQLVNLRREVTPGRIELIGRTLTLKVAAALDRREQVILLMNRRGYASYVFCPHGDFLMTCDHCSRAMVFHQATQLVLCHYCQHTQPLPEACPHCKGKILLFGMGIQRIEGELARKFPTARVARMDSDTMTSVAQFQKVFEEFGRGQVDILLGTQMVAKGLDFPRVSLVGVVSADTSLTIPDFRAAERTFQLIVQVAGRAGRADVPGEVIVQTLHEEEPAIQAALQHDYDGFAARELGHRQDTRLPPFSRMVRFIVRHSNQQQAFDDAQALGKTLRQYLPREVTLYGPAKAPVERIQSQYRFEIRLTTPRAGIVQQFLAPRMELLVRGMKSDIIADADPTIIH